ncbi:MAG: hypothetical protein EBR81_05780 [Proteobacteria bacterium]|nr:hypothetical protein [Pseudomonadota bacterium]
MKTNSPRYPSFATAALDFELWLRWGIGSGVLSVVNFINLHLFRKRYSLRNPEVSPLFRKALREAVLKIWRWVCVPLWELDGGPIKKRPFSSGAFETFQQLSKLITSWNARFSLDCWPGED